MTSGVNSNKYLKSSLLRGFFFCLTAMVGFGSCNSSPELVLVRNHGYTQGTTYSISYLSPQGEDHHKEIVAVFGQIDSSLNTYKPSSLVSQFNQSDSGLVVDEHVVHVVSSALSLAKQSAGRFDPTIAPLTNAWGFGYGKRMNLNKAKVDSLMKCVGFEKVRLSADNFLSKDSACIALDLNAIAQGYTVDLIADRFDSLGIKNYMIDVGGELRCKGKNSKGEVWRIGIDKPVAKLTADRIQAVVELKDIAIATSGNYRKSMLDSLTGIRYSHSINAQTGYPVKSRLLSVSILAKSCMDADAYATLCMLVGLKAAQEWVVQQEGVEAYFIYSDKDGNWSTWATDGFKFTQIS